MKKLAIQLYSERNLTPQDDFDKCGHFFNLYKNDPTAKCYMIGREFGKKLMNVKLDILPKYFFNITGVFYIEFLEEFYIDIIKFSGCVFINTDGKDPIILLFSTLPDRVCSMNLIMDNEMGGQTLEETVAVNWDKETNKWTDSAGIGVEVIRWLFTYAINCILYVNSGDPDLRHLKPPICKAKSKKGIRKFKREFPIEIDMVNVGFNYKKSIIYSTNETNVSGHFRWQPCGPKLCTIKLIWIDEHKRKFNV